MNDLIEHHIKYKEIHGEDKTVWMTKSEHRQLHMRLRNEGKCNVPVDELRRISNAANSRTDKEKKHQSNYFKHCMQQFIFNETVGKNVRLIEYIRYNHKMGTVYYSSVFSGGHGYKLPCIDI